MHLLSKKQWIAMATVAVLLVSAGSMLGFWAYYHWLLGIDLKNQSVVAQLPSRLEATVESARPFPIYVQGAAAVTVPLQQSIVAPLHSDFPTQVKLDIPVPLDFSVPFQATIPINSAVDIETDTAAILPHLPSMPLKIRLPIQFEVPVDTIIPVKTTFRFQYTGPLDVGLNQTIRVPLDTQLKSTLTLADHLQVSALGPFAVGIYPQSTVAIQLHGAIRQPFKNLVLRAD